MGRGREGKVGGRREGKWGEGGGRVSGERETGG